jgi:hypothetical protein
MSLGTEKSVHISETRRVHKGEMHFQQKSLVRPRERSDK